MTAATFVLNRHEDISGVSGIGVVCEGVEFSDGAVAVRWLGAHPSTTAWGDMRDMEAVHGHSGLTVVEYDDAPRLLRAYQRVVPYLLSDLRIPTTIGPHPDHPDRLRLTFKARAIWRFWVALLEGSTDAATYHEINAEICHRWITPDGDLWLEHYALPQHSYPPPQLRTP